MRGRLKEVEKCKQSIICLILCVRIFRISHVMFLVSGIFVEGVGSFLDGLFGTGNGTTSTSVNVGVVGITKVCVRKSIRPTVWQHFSSFPFLHAF